MARSTTRSNTTTARGCPSIRRSSRAGRARRRLPRRGRRGRPRRDRPELRPDRRARPSTCSKPTRRRHDGPLALFIHGGYWRSLEPSSFSQMARGMNAHGVTVAVVGLRPLPAGVDRRRSSSRCRHACLFLWKRFGQRIMVTAIPPAGISPPAWWRPTGRRSTPSAPADLVPAGYAISGLYRSRAARCISPPTPTSSSTPPRRGASRRCSGRSRAGACSTPWSAARNSSEFLRQSRIVADAWREQRRRDPLRGDPRHEPLHRLRSDDRSEQRDDEAAASSWRRART